MTANDHELLAQFTREHSQEAFTELVKRHLNLVYSAALRQVRSPELAEEVSQSVFTTLARDAATLQPETILTAWLYQVTRHTAIDVVRRESRRQAREQIAFQMSETKDTTAEWKEIEPLLDEAMQSLDGNDRAAILLRFFENKSLREVGEALGASEDAAQKRVSRAVDRLREFFEKRKVSVGASGLGALLSVHAVQSAPSGLAAALAGSATAAAVTSVSSSTAVTTVAKTIAMTTLQKTLVITALTGAVAVGVYQTHRASKLSAQVQTLQAAQEHAGALALSNRAQRLPVENERSTNAQTALPTESAASSKSSNEALRLRGEIGRLRLENAQIGSTNALSKLTANPEARKMLREQQKRGMAAIYKEFAQGIKLAPEQTDQFNDLLADHIMENVGHVTTALRDKLTGEQMDQLFVAQDAAFKKQVETLLGPEGVAQYDDYTRNLLSTLTAAQFKGLLTGTDEARADKSKQLRQLLQDEVRQALANAGLPADYQAVPMLNFRNIASEQEAERSLKLLDSIYQQVATRGSSFLSPEELVKFGEFRTQALNTSRLALTVNRTMMAPISN